MFKKLSIVSFVMLLQLPAVSGAQSQLGLNYPMGIPVSSGSSISQSLGGTGVAIENDFLGAANNPANLGSTHRTTFSTTVAAQLLVLDDNGTKNNLLNASLSTLALSVPISKYGTIGLSVSPESSPSVRYHMIAPFDETSTLDNSENSLFLPDSAEIGIIRTGNALSWQVAWGYDLLKKVRIGIALKRYNFTQNTAELLSTSGNLTSRLNDSTYINFHTNALRGGIIVPVKKLTLGLSGDYYFVNKATLSRSIIGIRYNDTISSKETYDLHPAPSVTAGLSYQISNQWFAAADMRYTLWDRYVDKNSSASLDNAITVSAGAQFVPAPNLLTPKFYEITQYRAGIRYSQLPGAQGSERALTLAAGLPMQTNGGVIDIIVELAQRSDERFSTYRENMVGLKLGINAGRKWYQSGNQSY